MSTYGNEKERDVDRSEDPIRMDDQGPSYSSSYNESTPGEIVQNRQSSLHDEEATGDDNSGGSEHDNS